LRWVSYFAVSFVFTALRQLICGVRVIVNGYSSGAGSDDNDGYDDDDDDGDDDDNDDDGDDDDDDDDDDDENRGSATKFLRSIVLITNSGNLLSMFKFQSWKFGDLSPFEPS